MWITAGDPNITYSRGRICEGSGSGDKWTSLIHTSSLQAERPLWAVVSVCEEGTSSTKPHVADECTRSCQVSESDSEKGAWTGRELIGPTEEPELRITSQSRTRAPRL